TAWILLEADLGNRSILRSAVFEQYAEMLEPLLREQDERELESFDREYVRRFGSCSACGTEFPKSSNGRKRRFCSSACRQVSSRDRKILSSGPGDASWVDHGHTVSRQRCPRRCPVSRQLIVLRAEGGMRLDSRSVRRSLAVAQRLRA